MPDDMLNKLQLWFDRFLLRQEYAWHMVDAYLAEFRDDKLMVSHHEEQAKRVKSKLDLIDFNEKYGGLRGKS